MVALVLGTALLVSSITSYLGARRLVRTVIQGQVQALQRTLGQQARERGPGPPLQEELTAFLEQHRDEGLRYVAQLGHGGEVLVAAGESVVGAGEASVADLRPGELDVAGQRVRAVMALDRPPHGHRPPPPLPFDDRGFHPPPPVVDGHPPMRPFQPPKFAMELVPEAALALGARARRDLGVGVTVAIALMLAAAVFWRLSRRVQAFEARLQTQQHLAALGEMSAVLAHELRNPLASLKGHAQLLDERVSEQPRLQRKTARIVDEAERLEALTNGLLEFARTGKIEPTSVDPRALLRRCASLVEGSVDIDTDHAPTQWVLDGPKIERVLSNLLDNARQAAPDTPVVARVFSERQRLNFEVRDSGPGIPAADRERIFEPFVTTRTRGTGLGLPVSRKIVEQHGGTLTLQPADGRGTCLVVSLPAGAELTATGT